MGYASDSRCASGLGYDDTGGGYLDQSDPRMYCTGGYCMGDTMMATSRGVCGEEVELDMRRHIQACACTCNHMGYGNYMDYQVSRFSREIRSTVFSRSQGIAIQRRAKIYPLLVEERRCSRVVGSDKRPRVSIAGS